MPAGQCTPDPLMRAGWEVEYNEMEYITKYWHATSLAIQQPNAKFCLPISWKSFILAFFFKATLAAHINWDSFFFFFSLLD